MDEDILKAEFDGYSFGFMDPSLSDTLPLFIPYFENPSNFSGSVSALGGRAPVLSVYIEGVGRVVIKHLTRGGVLGRFVSHSYMRRGRPRAEDEFRRLAQAVSLGIRVPKPILYAVKGGMVYRCWIATKEVSSAITLADLSTKDEDLARTATADAATEIAKLITHSIYHIDLHPGNVIVDSAGRVYLMDFDKTRKFRGNINQLRDSYICRWRRAVIKHGLPEYLSEIMSLNLRRDFFEASLAE